MSLKRILAGTALVALAVGFGGCDDGKAKKGDYNVPAQTQSKVCPRAPAENYTLGAIISGGSSSGYVSPRAPSKKCETGSEFSTNNFSVAATVAGEGTLYFMDAPTYELDGNNIITGNFAKAPKIYSKVGTQAPNVIYTFPNSEFSRFYNGECQTTCLGETEHKARGIFLDLIVLGDNSILFSSNVSDEIVRIAKDGVGNYIQDATPLAKSPEVYGTDQMRLFSNGRIHAAQSRITDETGVTREAREISVDPINSKNEDLSLKYKIEFSLPPSDSVSFKKDLGNGSHVEIGNKHSISENSIQGTAKNGYLSFATRYQDGALFGWNGTSLEAISKGSSRPTSLRVLNKGDIVYTLAPILNQNFSSIVQNSGINSNDGMKQSAQDSSLHSFSDLLQEWQTGQYLLSGTESLPAGADVSLEVEEDATKVVFKVTSTGSGDLKSIEFPKIVSP